MWPSSLTCYLQWLNKCVFVMAKKSPDEPQTACINSILPGTITNASELFCIRRKDNAKHFWKHCHPSNSQHIPLQHTCIRKKPQNISEHSYPYCYPCLTAIAPHHAPTLWSILWSILWADTMATNSCPTLWPSHCMNVAGKYWWFGLFIPLGCFSLVQASSTPYRFVLLPYFMIPTALHLHSCHQWQVHMLAGVASYGFKVLEHIWAPVNLHLFMLCDLEI